MFYLTYLLRISIKHILKYTCRANKYCYICACMHFSSHIVLKSAIKKYRFTHSLAFAACIIKRVLHVVVGKENFIVHKYLRPLFLSFISCIA